MHKRVIDGNALWTSDKLALVDPRFRAEYANLIPLATSNGTFEANPKKIHRLVYAYNRPDIAVEQVAAMLNEFEHSKMLFRWEQDGKNWGYFVGIEKEGRLPAPSHRKYEKIEVEVPQDQLTKFLAGATQGEPKAETWVTQGIALTGSGSGFGFGVGSEYGSGSKDAVAENSAVVSLCGDGSQDLNSGSDRDKSLDPTVVAESNPVQRDPINVGRVIAPTHAPIKKALASPAPRVLPAHDLALTYLELVGGSEAYQGPLIEWDQFAADLTLTFQPEEIRAAMKWAIETSDYWPDALINFNRDPFKFFCLKAEKIIGAFRNFRTAVEVKAKRNNNNKEAHHGNSNRNKPSSSVFSEDEPVLQYYS
jgi:hypothetical protein